MQNDSDLLDFNTWRAEHRESDDSGEVLASNDHSTKSCTVWWCGPETDLLRRMHAEAQARGITLVIRHARYASSQVARAAELLFAGTDALVQAGFELAAVAGPSPEFDGLTITGAPVGDETARELSPALVASVQDVITALLDLSPIPATDVHIGYGRVLLC